MEVIVAATVGHYRKLASTRIQNSDSVMEIGCSTGETTRLLAAASRCVLAIDCSDQMVSKTKVQLACSDHVRVVKADARDTDLLAQTMPEPDAIFLDVGGNQQLDKIATIVRGLMLTYQPRLLVVRNEELAAFASLICDVERIESTTTFSKPNTPKSGHGENAISALMDLSDSHLISNRAYAARKLKDHIHIRQVYERIVAMQEDASPTIRRLARGILINHKEG